MGDKDEQTIRVLKGDPTPEEVAALVAAMAQKTKQEHATGTGSDRPSTWAAYWRSVQTPPRPGPDAWRVSGLPRPVP